MKKGEFSPNYWLDIKPHRKSYYFDDPMERIFYEKFGVDTFTFVHRLYSFSGCQWEVENAYAFLQLQLDNIWRDMRLQNGEWVTCDFNPFEDSPTGATFPDGSPWERAAVG